MEKKEIIVSVVKSNNSDNNVYAVSISGEGQTAAHCKTAYKAMRFMFLLKKRTGFYISDNCLAKLSYEIARQKSANAETGKQVIAEAAQGLIGTHSVNDVLADEPENKPARRPRIKKSVKNAAGPV